MSTRSRTTSLLLLLIATAALLLVGCGSSDDDGSDGGGSGNDTAATTTGADGGGDNATDAARELFTDTCGGCHTLSDAGTSGSVGPNLDEASPDEATVKRMIENGGGSMPGGLLEGADADAVAKYVADHAGK